MNSPSVPKYWASVLVLLVSVLAVHAQQTISPITDSEAVAPVDASQDAIISERETLEVVEDSSVAEAVERRPDLSFSNVTIDGEKATVSLDEISAESVSSLEVLRAVTPDMDADSRGGSLNLESNPTFNLKAPVIKAALELQYAESGDKLNKNYNVTYGNAYGDFGFNLNATYSDSESYGEVISNNWDEIACAQSNYFVLRDTFLRLWNAFHEEHSVNLKMDYKISEILSVYFKTNYEYWEHEEEDPSIVYRFGEGDFSEVSDSAAISLGARFDRDLLGYNSTNTEYFYQTGGVAKWNQTKIDFQVSINDSSYFEPNWFIIQFEHENVDLFYDITDPLFPELRTTTGMAPQASDYAFDELLDEVWSNDQTDLIGTVNIKRDFEWNGYNAYVKGGLKFRSRNKDQRADASYYTSYNGDFTLADVLSSNTYQIDMHSEYVLSPVADVAKSRAFYEQNFDHFVYDTRRSREKSDPNTFEIEENIAAAYLMLNVEKGRLRGIAGLRFEQTDLDYVANEVVINDQGEYVETVRRTGTSSYENLFPSVHLRYFLGEKMTLISAWTGTIKRPYYGQLVPYRHINYEDRYVSEGNPDLNPTLYDNFDLSLDYKLSETSQLSLELFYKQIDGIVFWEEVDVVGGMFHGFDLGRNSNGPSGTRQGIKLIWNQQLSELSDALDGFSLNAKMTFSDSETEYPNRPDEWLPITSNQEKEYQVSLTYDKHKTYVQLLWERNSNTLQGVDDNEWRDNYSLARDNVELNTSYQITESCRIFCNMSNLMSEPFRNYRGAEERPSFYRHNLKSVKFGVKMKL